MKKREGQWQNETMHSSSGAPKPKDKNEWNEDATESRPAGAATAVVADDAQVLVQLLQRWQQDPTATYHTWFRWEERIKNFRSIRRGLQAVVQEIDAGTFGNAYRGSSLEPVVDRKSTRLNSSH